jgi:hypothetical protein
MSSNLQTYFVVAYDHTDGQFYIDDEVAAARFNHDSWDEDEGAWVHLDHHNDVVESMPELMLKLQEALKKGNING